MAGVQCAQIFEEYKQLGRGADAVKVANEGDVEAALKGAAHTIEAEFERPAENLAQLENLFGRPASAVIPYQPAEPLAAVSAERWHS